jgi:hypothetical protein
MKSVKHWTCGWRKRLRKNKNLIVFMAENQNRVYKNLIQERGPTSKRC